MRRLVWFFLSGAVLWGVWWMLVSTAVETGLNGWLDDRRAVGWQADIDGMHATGFPGRIDLDLGTINLDDPETGVALTADDLRITALSYWPGDVTVLFPQTPIGISTPDVALNLTASNAQASLRLHPGTTLQLDHLNATSGPWQIDFPHGKLLNAQGFSAEMTQGDLAETYRFAIEASQLVPGGLVRTALSLPPDWPLAVEAMMADVTITFDTPLDRFTLEDRRPQPREVLVERVSLIWGPLKTSLKGRVRIDDAGVPDGQLDLLVENWRVAFDLAQKSGALAPNMRQQAEIMLNALANLGDDPAQLDLKLRFVEGRVFLGPVLIGPAPRLLLP
ncbi:MAG: DUF2125 domain-containing protein [Sulfitobacter sp.]